MNAKDRDFANTIIAAHKELRHSFALHSQNDAPLDHAKAFEAIIRRAIALADDDQLDRGMVNQIITGLLYQLAREVGLPQAAFDRAVARAFDEPLPTRPHFGVVSAAGRIIRIAT